MNKIGLQIIVISLLLVVNIFSQPRTFDKPSFPFEVHSERDKPYSQINIILSEEHFSRENLVQLFSYLGRNAKLPMRVAVFSDKNALEKEMPRTYADNSLESTPTWDGRMRSLAILNEKDSISSRAYYYKDSQAERFNYDLEKSTVRCIEITFYDGRKFENTSEFLFSSIKAGYTDAVRWFLRQEPKVNLESVDSTKSSPLGWAVWLHHNDIVKMLLAAGVKVGGSPSAGSPLFTAIDAKNLEGARILIEAKTDVEQVDWEGATPLVSASVICDYSMVKLLLESGAKANFKNKFGKTAIDYSCDSKNVKDLLSSYSSR